MASSLQEDIENNELKLFDFFPKIIASFVYNFILNLILIIILYDPLNT